MSYEQQRHVTAYDRLEQRINSMLFRMSRFKESPPPRHEMPAAVEAWRDELVEIRRVIHLLGGGSDD